MNESLAVIADTENGMLTPPALECVEEAREIADARGATVWALALGDDLTGLEESLAAHGADSATLIEHETFGYFTADGWLAALEPILKEMAPALVLAPDSGQARAWLPRLAARWRVPLVSGCLQVQVGAAGQIEMTRPTHGGARHERLACPGAATVLATLIPGARGLGAPRSNSLVRVTRLRPDLPVPARAGGSGSPAAIRDRTVQRIPPDPRIVDISEAERIVAGGLGVGGPEGIALLWQLAERLGAAVGGTRPLVDRGWLPFERQIGTTGKTVAPKLYLALGISGASQHTAGMVESETVVVVNLARSAPMFALADLGVVGDLRQIMPDLLKKLDKE